MRSILLAAAAATLLVLVPGAQAAGRTPRCHGKSATYVGTPGSDRIKYESDAASAKNPVLVLRGGDDRVDIGVYGNVAICGGPGDDRVSLVDGVGRPSRLVVDGGPGRDRIDPTGSTDELLLPAMTVIGGAGDDFIAGANGNDRLIGGDGDDQLFGEYGTDKIVGGAGDDLIDGNGDDDDLRGDDGDDFILGGGQSTTNGPVDTADGGEGADTCGAEVLESCETAVPDLDDSFPG